MRLSIALLAASAAFAATAAQAATVEIRDAVARVTVVPQDRADVKVEVVRQHPELPLSVSVVGDRTIVDGDLRRAIRDCDGMGEKERVRVRGVGRVRHDEMPQIVIYTPRDVVLRSNGAVAGAIGRSASLDLRNSGCSAWTVADVAGDVQIDQSGAGAVRMGQAGRLELRLSGAGSVRAVRVRQGLDAHLSGAGGVHVSRLEGPMEAQVSGVGGIRIEDGRASHVRASVSGIGNVEFGGTAQDLHASISGLGSVRVKEVTGSVTKSVSGIGTVKVSNRPT